MPTAWNPLPLRTLLGAQALAALAVPARFAILNHLLAAGPRTASQCAAVVGETPSNCSWHLRALAKVGLVEPAEPPETDARVRPWRATVVGIEVPEDSGPAGEVARAALAGITAQHADELYRRYLAGLVGTGTALTAALQVQGCLYVLAGVMALRLRPSAPPTHSGPHPDAVHGATTSQ